MIFYLEMARNCGVYSKIDAFKMLEKYFADRELTDAVVASLYYLAACHAYRLPEGKREDLIQVVVWDMVRSLPVLAAKKSAAEEFASWMHNRVAKALTNKKNTCLKKDDKERALMVEGDRPTSDDGALDFFSTLRAPLDTEQAVLLRAFVDSLAGIVVEDAPRYTLGLWQLLAIVYSPTVDVASLFHAGEFSSFKKLLAEQGVSSTHLEQLMSALEMSWVAYMKEPKEIEQTESRVRAYKWRVKTALIRHPELHQYFRV